MSIACTAWNRVELPEGGKKRSRKILGFSIQGQVIQFIGQIAEFTIAGVTRNEVVSLRIGRGRTCVTCDGNRICIELKLQRDQYGEEDQRSAKVNRIGVPGGHLNERPTTGRQKQIADNTISPRGQRLETNLLLTHAQSAHPCCSGPCDR